MSGIKPTGAHKTNRLTPAAIRNLKPGLHADGGCLHLRIDDSGARRWVLRIVIQGKRRDIGLGSAALVSLKEAREAALQHRKAARAGDDPLAAKRRLQAIPTFEEAARLCIEQREGGWQNEKHRKQWSSTLETYAYPLIGSRQINKIDGTDVLSVLDPIWTDKNATAKRVKQRIGVILKWSIARGYRTDNPADAVQEALTNHNKSNVRHMPALPYGEVSKAISKICASKASTATKLAIQFLVHTACRSGEVRGALWDEIDLERRVWILPAERTKMKREHRVPLTDTTLAILENAKALRRKDVDLVFPSATGKQLSDMTLSKLIKELSIAAVPHGFRSSFRDWAGEATQYPNEVIEFCMAHKIKNKAEAAYARSDLFEKRRLIMSDWSAFLATPQKSQNETEA